MKLRKLGESGSEVSVVGLGCNNFGLRIDLEATRKVIHKAIDVGITLFDTADIYGNRGGSENMIGQILGQRPHLAQSACLAGQGEFSTILHLVANLIAARVSVDLRPLYGQVLEEPSKAADPAGRSVVWACFRSCSRSPQPWPLSRPCIACCGGYGGEDHQREPGSQCGREPAAGAKRLAA